MTVRSSNVSSPTSDAKTSSSKSSPSSVGSSPTRPRPGDPAALHVGDAANWGPILVVRALFDQLGLWAILDQHLGRAKGVPFADRAFVLVANRLIAPASEHDWPVGSKPTSSATARADASSPIGISAAGSASIPASSTPGTPPSTNSSRPRTTSKWRSTSPPRPVQPQARLVLYDITSTYFEGAGPQDFAQHGYSRDGKPQNVQVIVGMVMVAGWPIAHHVWAGNRVDNSTVQEVIRDCAQRFAFGRLVFVGDRGMVTDENIEAITKDEQGFLVGVKRRRNPQIDGWLDAVDETKWIDCPGGINTRERKTNPPRTRAQEVPSGDPDLRVIVIDSDEHAATSRPSVNKRWSGRREAREARGACRRGQS